MRVVIRCTGTVLPGGHVGLLGLDALIQGIEPLGDFECLAGKRRCVLGGGAQGAGKCLVDLAVGQMQRVLCILALLRHSGERGQLAGDAERRLVHESAGGREGRGSIELEGGIAARGQVLANEEGDKYQRQDAGQAEAAEITELTQTDLGEWGEMGHMGHGKAAR